MTKAERSGFLSPLILPSMDVATALGRTLTLVRPSEPRFRWKAKTDAQIEAERRKYKAASAQLSLVDTELASLDPCPYSFKFEFKTADGITHEMACEDWETAATFYRWERLHGAKMALDRMSVVFNEEYPAAGMAFAMGTHSRRREQWLLVGVLRLNLTLQAALDL